MWNMKRNISEILERVAEGVQRVIKEVIGVSKNSMLEDKKIEEMQEIMLSNKLQLKKWRKSRDREDWMEYTRLSKATKNALNKA